MTDDQTGLMKCLACFDVKDEEGKVEEGTKGIGACSMNDGQGNHFLDANYFGTVEAAGSDSFKFKEASKNNWDRDQSGYRGLYSNSMYTGNTLYASFVSNPLDVNSNSPKNLGI